MVFFAPYSFQTKPDQPPCLDGVVQGEEEGRSVLMYTDEVRGCNFCQADFNHASSYKTFIYMRKLISMGSQFEHL